MRMIPRMQPVSIFSIGYAVLFATIFLAGSVPLTAQQSGAPADTAQNQSSISGATTNCDLSRLGSPFIPVDSWLYPAMQRLYALGYVDTAFLGMRPWTRSSVVHMLQEAEANMRGLEVGLVPDEAQALLDALSREFRHDAEDPCGAHQGRSRVESAYSVVRGISGTPLRDSFHLGSTIVNDYGRPYANGFNNYTGASGYASAGHFQLYVRGEFHGAPSASGYSAALTNTLAALDGTTYYFTPACWSYIVSVSCGVPLPDTLQTTIPFGPVTSTANARLLEAYISYQYLNHVISFGKEDEWQGPGVGGAMSYSNNAENIYAFHINRVEPLHVPLLSRITGPFRYEFLVGPLRGHTYPIDPWVHIEKVSLRPTKNVEFGFERTVIWGGKGHEPITIKTFLRSFFSTTAPIGPGDTKNTPQDPGARFGAFDFSYRLPFVRNWLMVYADSEAHDDVSPADNPRHAGYRPGIYLSHVPYFPKVDVRVEGLSTDPSSTRSIGGQYNYWEAIQRQGYTNQGQLFGDWIGREAKGGQAWIAYHLSGNEWVQASVRNQKAPKDFIAGGTTLNDISFQVVKRLGKDYEIDGTFALEHWKAPIYLPGGQTVTTTTIQLTWLPQRKASF